MTVATSPKATTYRAPEPGNFNFTEQEWQEAQHHLNKYPEHHKVSAVVPLLWICQRKLGGSLTYEAIEYVAQILKMAPIRVHEVAHFYSMFKIESVGRYLLQVCRTTPCMLRGSDDLIQRLNEKLGVGLNEVTPDGMFSIEEVECLGACCNGPMVQINDWYCEDLTPEAIEHVIDSLRCGERVAPGSQRGRLSSEPEGGLTSLKEVDDQGHPRYAFRGGAEAEPEEVRLARAAADDNGDGET